MLASLFAGTAPVRYAFVVTAPGTKECTGEGFVQFATEAECKAALEAVQGHSMLGKRVKLAYAQRRHRKDALLGAVEEPPAGVEAKRPKREHRGRLIVRNLAFAATEDHLRSAFAAYGPLVDVSLARKPDGQLRGFGFVECPSEELAQKAMEEGVCVSRVWTWYAHVVTTRRVIKCAPVFPYCARSLCFSVIGVHSQHVDSQWDQNLRSRLRCGFVSAQEYVCSTTARGGRRGSTARARIEQAQEACGRR